MMERVKRVAFAAAVTAALGFGTVQFPVRPDTTCDGVGPCNDTVCARICRAAGFVGGFCNGGGGCSCYL